jgi:hypothetical protein
MGEKQTLPTTPIDANVTLSRPPVDHGGVQPIRLHTPDPIVDLGMGSATSLRLYNRLRAC